MIENIAKSTGSEQSPANRAALKEWALTCKALADGTQILLIRKGALRDKAKTFQIEQESFYLFPTYDHQKRELVKPPYHAELQALADSWSGPATVKISAWAEVTDVYETSEREKVEALTPYHIWSGDYADLRLGWRPTKPLAVVVMRVYHLAEPKTLPVLSEYGGCTSWITLAEPVSRVGMMPVLSDDEFEQRRAEIRSTLGLTPSLSLTK